MCFFKHIFHSCGCYSGDMLVNERCFEYPKCHKTIVGPAFQLDYPCWRHNTTT